ncbi:MAG: transposase domain-containing protein [Pontiella sp.]
MPDKLSGFGRLAYEVGEKNFHFFGSPESGQTSAIIYSLIETCRKLDINPANYLREVLMALPTMNQFEIANWTPTRWKSNREITRE